MAIVAQAFRRRRLLLSFAVPSIDADEGRDPVARISFTANLERHVQAPTMEVAADSVKDALDRVFQESPRLRSYVVDEHGRLRKHVNVYLNDSPIRDRVGLSDPVTADDEIFVFQALSGGAS